MTTPCSDILRRVPNVPGVPDHAVGPHRRPPRSRDVALGSREAPPFGSGGTAIPSLEVQSNFTGAPGFPTSTPPRNRCLRRALSATTAAILCLALAGPLLAQPMPRQATSSLLLLIDVSGSMQQEVGDGNPEIKIVAAKQAASEAVQRALQKRTVEVAILAFSGECTRPVPRYLDFTSDFQELTRFINTLQADGGTPMAPALSYANRFMKDRGAPTARDHMIVLLADGENQCGNVADALDSLQAAGIIFRHETVGFGIAPNSRAATDLRHIATSSGGVYHHAADATQLGDVFAEFVDTFSAIDLLGTFRRRPTQPAPPTESQPAPTVSPEPSVQRATDLVGLFRRDVPQPQGNQVQDSTSMLCYRRFVNPQGLEGLRDSFAVTEYTCASSCPTAATRVWAWSVPAEMSCAQQCAFAAGPGGNASGRSVYENHCVPALDPLRSPVAVTHYYCDYTDNKHRVIWQQPAPPPTGGFRVYLNHYPNSNADAKFLGVASGERFDFEYGIDYRSNPVIGGLNQWNPFPAVGVSACNRYGICTPPVYGELGGCTP